jgi:hypothetical protein
MRWLSFASETPTSSSCPSADRPGLRANDVCFARWVYSAHMEEVFKKRLTVNLGWRNIPITLKFP